jgi:ribonucleoside-triphosphate reductase
MFNCSYANVETVHDLVDIFWLLLQGCGTGFTPIPGCLSGFCAPIPHIEIIPSSRESKGGADNNTETFKDGVWTIIIGDTAEAWAKSVGKLVAGKYPGCKRLILDMREVRPAGQRLSRYGWVSNGDRPLGRAFRLICNILNEKAGCLLTALDIKDIVNLLGTVLSSRRSAQLAHHNYGHPGWQDFARCKTGCWTPDSPIFFRQQSNNSLVFNTVPTRPQLSDLFDLILDSGGNEPGFINGTAARQRAPWWSGVNPCCEVLLPNRGFCNLVEVNISAFQNDRAGLLRAIYILARANYRQTCVELRDGVLQDSWHQNNQFLRLCGVSLTGIACCPYLTAHDLRQMRYSAITGAISMADDLAMPRPKNITCGKPSGTISKVMDTTEGIHRPIGRYIFNWVGFSRHDPILSDLSTAGYRIIDKPSEPEAVLVCFPHEWPTIPFSRVNSPAGPVYVNTESAVDQLERYRLYMDHWCDQNMSCTISYAPDEMPSILDWLVANWDSYVGVSWSLRVDATKTAADLGASYLPQELVSETTFHTYVSTLQPLPPSFSPTPQEILDESDCPAGVCPAR